MIDTETSRLCARLIEHFESFGWWESDLPELSKFNELIQKLSGKIPFELLHSDLNGFRTYVVNFIGFKETGGLVLSRYRIVEPSEILEMIAAKSKAKEPCPRSQIREGVGLILFDQCYGKSDVRNLRHCVEDWRDSLAVDSPASENWPENSAKGWGTYLGVDPKTINNWHKSKPYLIKRIKTGFYAIDLGHPFIISEGWKNKKRD